MRTKKLEKLRACNEAIVWVKTQTSAKNAWMNCNRGDWMLWLAKILDVDDKKLTLAKALCAKQVEHLMKDQRSKDALQSCFDYASGKISRSQLTAVANAADAAAAAAYAVAVYTANAATTRKFSLKKSADICRKILTKEVLQKYKKIKVYGL